MEVRKGLFLGALLLALVCGTAHGQRIAFVSDRDGNAEIYSMQMDGSDQERLTFNPEGDFCPVFSPDGQRLAFISYNSGTYDIYTMNWDGTDLFRVPNTTCQPGDASSGGRALSWSPDGSGFVFTPTRTSLATINADGTNKQVRLTGGVGVHTDINGVEWGPTLNDIYFNAQPTSDGYNQHIFLLEVGTGATTQVTLDAGPPLSQAPQVCPDLRRIAFHRQLGYSELKNIWTMNLDGTDMVQLTFDSAVHTLNVNPRLGWGHVRDRVCLEQGWD